MDAFDTYAGKMLALAVGYDAGDITLKRMNTRAASIRSDYGRACNCNLEGQRPSVWNPFTPSLNPVPP